MKIGIITFHSANNFGANLQVYSTIGYLKKLGFNPLIINWIPEEKELLIDDSKASVQAEAHRQFVKNNLPCSEVCKTDEDIVNVIESEKIKGIIIGSDAVFRQRPFLWRIHLKRKGIILAPKPTIDWRFPNPFWGSFIPSLKENIPIVAMSVSCQNTQYRFILGRYKMRMRTNLNRFKFITVRDEWTREMVKYLTRKKIVPSVTPDPVFAYNQNITNQISKSDIREKFKLPDKYILISFRTEEVVSVEWLRSFGALASQKGLTCVVLTMPDGITFEHPFDNFIEPPLSPEEWYALIKYSSGYVGENMHPIVVALHNSVPFYSFDSYGIVKYKFFVKKKSSKIYDLLNKAGFLGNMINILGRSYVPPSPEEVFLKVVNFDTNKSSEFSTLQQERYNEMMNKILTFFNI